jgi:hypothetical protein
MPPRLRHVLLFALLLVVPLQGTAAAIGPLLCLLTAEHAAAYGASHRHHAHAPDHRHDGSGFAHEHEGQQGAMDHAGHLCCHYSAPAGPTMLELRPQPDWPLFDSHISLISMLHVPDLPQRPPRV